jgi:hypothetical protein
VVTEGETKLSRSVKWAQLGACVGGGVVFIGTWLGLNKWGLGLTTRDKVFLLLAGVAVGGLLFLCVRWFQSWRQARKFEANLNNVLRFDIVSAYVGVTGVDQGRLTVQMVYANFLHRPLFYTGCVVKAIEFNSIGIGQANEEDQESQELNRTGLLSINIPLQPPHIKAIQLSLGEHYPSERVLLNVLTSHMLVLHTALQFRDGHTPRSLPKRLETSYAALRWRGQPPDPGPIGGTGQDRGSKF